jgi:hypothetical protein
MNKQTIKIANDFSLLIKKIIIKSKVNLNKKSTQNLLDMVKKDLKITELTVYTKYDVLKYQNNDVYVFYINQSKDNPYFDFFIKIKNIVYIITLNKEDGEISYFSSFITYAQFNVEKITKILIKNESVIIRQNDNNNYHHPIVDCILFNKIEQF